MIWELRTEHPIVNLRVFLDRNLTIGAVLVFIVGAVLYGTTSVLPLFMQKPAWLDRDGGGHRHESKRCRGDCRQHRGCQSPGFKRIDGRMWMCVGCLLLAWSMFELGGISNQTDIRHLIIPIVVSSYAITTIFVPMTTYSMATVPKRFTGNATGLTSLLRNLGGSVGISLLTTLIARGSQAHHALLVGRFSPYEPASWPDWNS